MNKGIVYILIATCSFAIMNILVKALSDMHVMQVVFFRAMGTFALIMPYMVYHKISIIGNHPKILTLRAIVGLISLATFFMAIKVIPLGSAISLRYIGPIFGAILAYYILKEKVNRWQWLSFLIAFSGVLVLKGFDLRISYTGLFLSLTSALFIGVVFVLIRYLATREHYLTIINYFMSISIIASLVFLDFWRWPIDAEWYAIIFVGIFGLVGQVFMTKAFSLVEATILAPFKYMEILYALIMGYFFFGESYDMLAFAGIVLIVSGMVVNVLVKSR